MASAPGTVHGNSGTAGVERWIILLPFVPTLAVAAWLLQAGSAFAWPVLAVALIAGRVEVARRRQTCHWRVDPAGKLLVRAPDGRETSAPVAAWAILQDFAVLDVKVGAQSHRLVVSRWAAGAESFRRLCTRIKHRAGRPAGAAEK